MKSQPRTVRSRIRQSIRSSRHQASVAQRQTGRTIDRQFFGRFGRLRPVRRFVIGWLLLFVLLIGSIGLQDNSLTAYYQHAQPVPGGIFREGIVGTFTNANPIYAVNDVDSAVSKLLFAGLFKYDDHNKLVGDLAESWHVDATGQIYTIKLRPHLVWQDGQPLTADDVVFTYQAIQNPDAESPLRDNWTDIKVVATDKQTVTFTLPNPLSSFVYNLTNGIVPAHLLRGIPMTGLRSAPFNTEAPIGAGPFSWHDIHVSGDNPSDAQQRIGLLPFAQYWAGEPKLKTFSVNAFANPNDMVAAYKDQQLNAMAGLDHLPRDIDTASRQNSYSFPMTAATMVFFRTTDGVLKDKAVRQALVAAAKPNEVIKQLGYSTIRVDEPVLTSQFAYNPKYAQQTNRLAAAQQQLGKAGWRTGQDGIRTNKHRQRLSFSLLIADNPEQRLVAKRLKAQWQRLGVAVQVMPQDSQSFHDALVNHDYDAVLYAVSIGVDPDVFVYWHSSQNDVRSTNRLNLSEYKSATADLALEAGRTRTGVRLRQVKYNPFLQAWQADAPALGLYQPRFLYVTRTPIYGLTEHALNQPIGRYNNVSNWMVRTANVTNDTK